MPKYGLAEDPLVGDGGTDDIPKSVERQSLILAGLANWSGKAVPDCEKSITELSSSEGASILADVSGPLSATPPVSESVDAGFVGSGEGGPDTGKSSTELSSSLLTGNVEPLSMTFSIFEDIGAGLVVGSSERGLDSEKSVTELSSAGASLWADTEEPVSSCTGGPTAGGGGAKVAVSL